MPKYVIYARKSTDSDDRQVLSIDSQTREMRTLAQRHGIEIGEILSESRSAKAPGRPVFGELMRRIQRGEINGVLCWKLDRLARNPYDSGLVLQAQADGKLERIITSDGVKTADGNDRLMGTFELAIATKFIDDLRANVKRGNRARFERGWPNYRPPLGYLNDRARKTVIKDPERFRLVRRILEMAHGGMRPRAIATIARERWGLRSPRCGKLGGTLISYSSVHRLLTNRFYAGYIDLKDGRSYLGAHEPMIPLDQFERVQELLGRRAHPHDAAHENPVAGLIRCGNCRCSVVAEFHRKAGRDYTYFRCSRAKPGVRCREKPLSLRGLKQQLGDYFRQFAIPEPILAFLRERLTRLDATNGVSAAAIVEQRQKAVRGLEHEERELLGLRMRQLIDDKTFQRERTDLQQRRHGLTPAASPGPDMPSPERRRAGELGKTLDVVQGGPLVVAKGAPFQLRSLLVELQLEIVLRGRRLDFTAPKPLSTLVEAGRNSSWQAYWPELWKWVMYGDVPDSALPSDEECKVMMAEQDRMWQEGGHARRRACSGQLRRDRARLTKRPSRAPDSPKDTTML